MDKTEFNEEAAAAEERDEFPDYIGGDATPATAGVRNAEARHRAETVNRVLNAPAGETAIRFALLHKYDLVATLILKTTADAGVIIRDDPREEEIEALPYETPEEARRHFDDGLRDSMRNGWAVSFDRTPALG